jgi:hypothetical protein
VLDSSDAAAPSYFRWNFWGWFGPLAAFSGQPLATAVVLLPQAPWVAAIWFGCSAIVFAAALILWRNRVRIRAYTALQSLVLIWGIGLIISFGALQTLHPEIAEIAGWRWSWSYPLMLPAVLMAVFALKEHAARRNPQIAATPLGHESRASD